MQRPACSLQTRNERNKGTEGKQLKLAFVKGEAANGPFILAARVMLQVTIKVANELSANFGI